MGHALPVMAPLPGLRRARARDHLNKSFNCTRSAAAPLERKKQNRSVQGADIMAFVGWKTADKLRRRLRRQEALVGGIAVPLLAVATVSDLSLLLTMFHFGE
jgi:hypothetical protein